MEQTTKTNESANSVLHDLNDRFIAKKKLKKTIISSVILSLIVILSALVISFASITISVQPPMLMGADVYMIVTEKDGTRVLQDDDAQFVDFINEYNSHFTSSMLTAIFTGQLGGYTIAEDDIQFYQSGSETTISSQLVKELDGNYIKLSFHEKQVLKDANGRNYVAEGYPENTVFTFTDCFLKLDVEQSNTMTFYLGTEPDGWGKTPQTTKIVVKASSTALYNALVD